MRGEVVQVDVISAQSAQRRFAGETLVEAIINTELVADVS
ncbi:hypothetical protein GA0115260_127751 [Streptomyces sp. MnatMP-M27]|nr:hypothetical protein GA0115260_127751 [Streptomyces sp. MnatMP-M27]